MAKITGNERAAIDRWLAENRVRECKVGESGIYDSFGEPLERSAKAYRMLSKKIRQLRDHPRMTHAQIAVKLGERLIDVRTACVRHKIETG
jgi:hypothetical protein